MTDKSRIQEWLDQPYQPEMGTGVATEDRIAKALEYSAHHLWQINQKLNRLISETANLGGLITMIDLDRER